MKNSNTLYLKDRTAPGGNYQTALEQLIEAGALDGIPAGAFRLEVVHAGDCDIWQGKACDCAPTFALSSVEERERKR